MKARVSSKIPRIPVTARVVWVVGPSDDSAQHVIASYWGNRESWRPMVTIEPVWIGTSRGLECEAAMLGQPSANRRSHPNAIVASRVYGRLMCRNAGRSRDTA